MVLEPPDVLEEADLTGSDKKILDALKEGRLTKGAIVERTDLHRNTVRNRLDVLIAADAVNAVHKGTKLYELVEDPRADEDDPKPNSSNEDVDALQYKLDQARDELEDLRVEKQRLERELHEAESQSIDVDELRDALADAQRAEKNLNRDNLEDALDRMGEILDA
ncbi:hypothetical protein V9T20_12515 (plasmid) [Halobacterium salinarum]|uniref:hypothetical protein n=1 Tax=Halobacterium salinarum TaxID=2242 RepID=UPI0030D23B30